MNESSFLGNFHDWSLGGISFEVAGNGGLECRDHVPLSRRITETCIGIGLPLGAYLIHKSTSSQKNPQKIPHQNQNQQYSLLRLVLLVSLSFVFGIEVGYKFASKQLIWLLNPCHVTSFLQIYLLTVPSHQTNNVSFDVINNDCKTCCWNLSETSWNINLHELIS